MIQADVKFPCHMSVDQTLDPEEIDFLDDDGIEYCIGQLAATKLLCKLPRDPEHAAAVQQVAQTMPDILHPMKEFCPHHRMELLKGKTHVEEEQG